jgi:hypothetical protein
MYIYIAKPEQMRIMQTGILFPSGTTTRNNEEHNWLTFTSSSPAAKRAVLKDIPWGGPKSAGCGGVAIGECLLH